MLKWLYDDVITWDLSSIPPNTIIFSKIMIFLVFNKSITNQPTDRQIDRRTDRPSYRDARSHLKIIENRCFSINRTQWWPWRGRSISFDAYMHLYKRVCPSVGKSIMSQFHEILSESKLNKAKKSMSWITLASYNHSIEHEDALLASWAWLRSVLDL